MRTFILYILTLAVFLALDSIGLRFLIRPVFEEQIGALLLDDFRIGPAILFYAFYIGCIIWFVSLPALSDQRPLVWVFGSAALMGAFGYGTYEFTNLATLRDWTWGMVATDLTWGVMLTATSATVGVAATRAAHRRLSTDHG